jgi:hypothetical protein
MTNRSSPTLLAHARWLTFFMSAVALGTGACASTGTLPSEQSKAMADPHTATTIIPGVPNLPDVVTVVPFYWKENETEQEKTKVVIPAEVDGLHSIFIVDLGCPPLILNRTFLQPSATGGIDTVTDANRIPNHIEENNPTTWDKVHVTMRIGTMLVKFDDPVLKGSYNAYLGSEWGNFGWNFKPRLGNIGLSVLEQFETIVDYTHRRLILIRLDSAGLRLANVPAYTPRWTAPLIDLPKEGSPRFWGASWGIAVQPDGVLDTLNASNNTQTRMMDTGAPSSSNDILGYPFLSQFGVIGFNHRTHQIIFYH